MKFWDWLVHTGLIQGDPAYYSTGQASSAEYANALQVAINNLGTASDPRVKSGFWQGLVASGVIAGDPGYYSGGSASAAEIQNAINVASAAFKANPTAGTISVPGTVPAPTPGIVDPGQGVTDVAPVQVGASTIPQGGRVVIINAPTGSDAAQLFYIVYAWRGLEFAFQVGDEARFNELFGSLANFTSVNTVSQAAFDGTGFIQAGLIDSELGATESFGSRVEREVAELGLEDLPSWLAGAPDALALVAEATADEWSSGRLWQELSTTSAFGGRFGTAWQRYMTEGRTIGEAVNALVADENALLAAMQPWLVGGDPASTTTFLQELLNNGWTPGAVAQVLEQGEVLRRDPDSLAISNLILGASGLPTLDEVGFLNALNGVGPQEVIEALNTATAARALDEAGIDIEDETINLIMELVDTSDRLLTADRWRSLAQELSFNLIRFNTELDQAKLGIEKDEIMAAAFGQESPSGRSAGEVMGLLARFERDRRAASQGFAATTGFLDDQGRLRIAGLSGL